MKLSELIAAYGDDLVQMQNLDECTDSLNMTNGITKVTFGTPQHINFNGTEKFGLVVWFDRERVKEIIASAALSHPASEEPVSECLWTDKPCTCGGAECEQVDFAAKPEGE